MVNKKAILKKAKFYVVLDHDVADFKTLFVILKATIAAGTTIVQVRSKFGSAQEVLKFVRKAKEYTRGRALLIVNDRADLVLAGQGDGMHVGQDDLSLNDAREILGHKKIIGVSCQTLAQARKAEKNGADYIGFGSVYPTKTKPERPGLDLRVVSCVADAISIPVFFIGGITVDRLEKILIYGGQRIAVTRAICESRNVRAQTRKFLDLLEKNFA